MSAPVASFTGETMADAEASPVKPSTPDADLIAKAVLSQFEKLPKKRKPCVRANGQHEWTILSGIVCDTGDGSPNCLALATGMKCLPASRLGQAKGIVVHDSHAEVLAIRAFNHLLLGECKKIGQGKHCLVLEMKPSAMAGRGDTDCGEDWHGQPFRLRRHTRFYMYSSEAPCGDASMEMTMSAQMDATPWAIAATPTSDAPTLLGREYFSRLGIVRRKPSRPDAEPTLSKSCSDKLALRQCTSLLSSTTALLISPEGFYLAGMVLPTSQYTTEGFERCFGPRGRMEPVANSEWPGGYSHHVLEPMPTQAEFRYSKRAASARAVSVSTQSTALSALTTCNVAVAWNCLGLEESLIRGFVQGKRPFTEEAASKVARKSLWLLARDAAAMLGLPFAPIVAELDAKDYATMKQSALLAPRTQAKNHVKKQALKGWLDNSPDHAFSLAREPHPV